MRVAPVALGAVVGAAAILNLPISQGARACARAEPRGSTVRSHLVPAFKAARSCCEKSSLVPASSQSSSHIFVSPLASSALPQSVHAKPHRRRRHDVPTRARVDVSTRLDAHLRSAAWLRACADRESQRARCSTPGPTPRAPPVRAPRRAAPRSLLRSTPRARSRPSLPARVSAAGTHPRTRTPRTRRHPQRCPAPPWPRAAPAPHPPCPPSRPAARAGEVRQRDARARCGARPPANARVDTPPPHRHDRERLKRTSKRTRLWKVSDPILDMMCNQMVQEWACALVYPKP